MLDELMTLNLMEFEYDDSILIYDEQGDCAIASDFNHDGNYEQIQYYSGLDFWGNPTNSVVMVDTDNDGNLDTYFEDISNGYGDIIAHVEANDYDQDGRYDMIKEFNDSTGNGQFDILTTIHYDNTDSPILETIDVQVDETGNQKVDSNVRIEVLDTTNSGNPDTVRITQLDATGQEYSYEMSYQEYIAQNSELTIDYTTSFLGNTMEIERFNPELSDPNLVSGNPIEDMKYWEHQGNTNRCAIYSQKFVLEEVLGRELPIEELVSIAEENGWYDDGTTSLNMYKLLDYYGVESEMSFDNDIQSLEEALQDGKNVIVSVDSGQIWYGNDNNIFSPDTRADHALQVIGIDRTNPECPMAILNDSGTLNGCGELVPLEIFENAWKAGDAQMIIC